MAGSASGFKRFVAIGDSFAEGVGDVEPRCPNGVRGWADRVAEVLARRDPEFRYANLALRGRLLPAIADEQLEPAVALEPDLVAICAGANDLIRPTVDIDALIEQYDAAIARLQRAGATVVTFTAYDTGGTPVFGALRGRLAIYNELLREVVDTRNRSTADGSLPPVVLVDFWRMHEYSERRMWEFDRMHLSSAGHQRMAIGILDALGVDHDLQPIEFVGGVAMSPSELRKNTRQWTHQYALPWVGRRLRGVSSGDALDPKYPELTQLMPIDAER